MTSYVFSPLGGAAWQFLTNSAQVLSNGYIYTYDAGTTTPATTWADRLGATPNQNPIRCDSAGRPSYLGSPIEIWLDASKYYKFVITDSDGGNSRTFDNIAGSFSGPALSSTATGLGASLIGDENGGTVQDFLDVFEVANVGTLPAGSTNAIDIEKIASSASPTGTSQFYSLVNRVYAQGAQPYDFVRSIYSGTHINTTTGTTNQADGIHAYVWQAGGGDVANIQGIASHVRVDGPGDVSGEAVNFRAVSLTLGAGATILTAKGLSIGQIGHASRVTNVYGVDVEDQQASTIAIGYRSQISSGTNRYQFFGAGTAASALGGNLGVGMTSMPAWRLTVMEPGATFISEFQNTAASPFGIRIRYMSAAPNTTDNAFITCADTVGNKLLVYSNGNVVNLNNSYGAISDRKLKTSISDAGSQLADIRALRIRKYKLKAHGKGAKYQIGVVAQEAMEVSPGIVSEGPDGLLSVNYSVLYLKALKALQELADIVEHQGKRLAALEGSAS